MKPSMDIDENIRELNSLGFQILCPEQHLDLCLAFLITSIKPRILLKKVHREKESLGQQLQNLRADK